MFIYHSSPLFFVGYSFFIPKISVPAPEVANERYRTCSPVLKEVPAVASATCWAVRSLFQTRTSSTCPVKNSPGGVTLEFT